MQYEGEPWPAIYSSMENNQQKELKLDNTIEPQHLLYYQPSNRSCAHLDPTPWLNKAIQKRLIWTLTPNHELLEESLPLNEWSHCGAANGQPQKLPFHGQYSINLGR